MDTKTCPRCRQDLPRTEEHWYFSKGRISAYCRPCSSAQANDWQKKNPDKRGSATQRWRARNPERAREMDRRNSRIQQLKRYGLSPADFDALVKAQRGRCAICGKKPAKVLHVDHDHDTGKVRGLLCASCNFALAQFGDGKLLAKALAYIKAAA